MPGDGRENWGCTDLLGRDVGPVVPDRIVLKGEEDAG